MEKRAWPSVALVIGLALFFGLVVLPRYGSKQDAEAGKPAPDFVLPVIWGGEAGNRIRLSNLSGKAVVLDFWASWCGPCKTQANIVDQIARRYESRDVTVIGINTGDSREAALAFLQSRALSYPSLLDDDAAVAGAYRVRQLPTLVVIDTQGRIVAVRRRLVREKELAELVDEALGT